MGDSTQLHLPRRSYAGLGLFVTGTGSDVGKTVVTAALAGAFRKMKLRVGVCKPVASGCPRRPARETTPMPALDHDDFESLDAVFAARAAGLDPLDRSLMRHVSPLRYATPVAPGVAARLEKRPVDWQRLATSLDWWRKRCDVLLVEGAGGWFVPLDENDVMIADLAAALRLPVLVVTHAALGTLNSTLLTVHAIRQRRLAVAGLVLNRVPPQDRRDVATATNLEELPRLSGTPVRAILPELADQAITDHPPEAFIDAMLPFAREWSASQQS